MIFFIVSLFGRASVAHALTGAGRQFFKQFVNLKQNFVGPRGSQRILQQPLRRELRAALGVARHQPHQVLRIDGRVLHEADLQFAALAIDLRNAHPLALQAQHGRLQQIDGRIGQRAVAVFHLRAHFGHCRLARRAGNLLVEPQPLIFFRHIALVDAQRNAQIQLRGRPLLAASRPSSPSPRLRAWRCRARSPPPRCARSARRPACCPRRAIPGRAPQS